MRAMTCMGQLFSLDFPRGSTMQPFLMKAKVISTKLLSMGAALSSLQMVALIIIKLPLDYDMVSRALRVQVTTKQLDFDDLNSLLLEEESLLVSQGKLSVTLRGSAPHSDEAYASVEKPKRSRSRCYKCKIQGHLARDCKPKKKDADLSCDSEATHLAHVAVEAVVPF